MAGPRSASRDPGLIGTVREVARGGEAIVATDEGIVLAAGALPGEVVRLGRVKKAGGARRGRVLEVLEPSPARIAAACALAIGAPEAGAAPRCGGCALMFASPDLRREVISGFVRSALRSGGAADLPVELIAAERDLGYRRRARLHVERGRIGWRARRSDALVDVERCPVLDEVLAAALGHLRASVLPLLAGAGEVRLAHGGAGGEQAVIALAMDGPQPPALYRAAETLAAQPGVAGVALDAGRTGTFATFGDPHERTPGADGRALEGTIGGFSQAHDEINARLALAVRDLADPAGARVLELYAGTGNLSVLLAPAAASFVAVEDDAASVAALRRNLATRDVVSARVIHGDAVTHAAGAPVDVVVLDPPRTGAREALAGIAARRPARIVYVSCDTATLGRDLAVLRDLGHVPDHALAFEMFPQTAHVETVVRLRRG